jgi:hypothetical protein
MEIFKHTDIKKILDLKEPIPIPNIPYWTCEIYGFGKYIREYGFYPTNWPLHIFTDHSGPSIIDKFNYFETNHDAPAVLLHNPDLVDKWRTEFTTPCYNLYSPFVFYRRKYNIERSKKAEGTIAYPAHTIPELDDVSNIEDYIRQLKSLPEKFHPISVSLHYHDLNKGMHHLFLDHGFRVFTAGDPADYKFTERFYSILANFNYSTSNIPGSYLFYAVEMGIPFFLYGNRPIYEKNEDSKLAEEALDCVNTRDTLLQKYEAAFASVTDCISPAQKDLVEYTLGIQHGITRFKMAKVLYLSYFKAFIKKSIKSSRLKSISLKKKFYAQQ